MTMRNIHVEANDDPLVDRISFEAKPEPLKPISWPDGLAPVPRAVDPTNLPEADVLVVTYTTAEAQALADVLAGVPSHRWVPYTANFAAYEGQLTHRSPARYSHDLGRWALTSIGGKSVLLFKSSLHLATDAKTLPMRQLWLQLLSAVSPKLVITTGTAGGIGRGTVLGDVTITNGAKFNCAREFKDAPFAQRTFVGPGWRVGRYTMTANDLIQINADRLKPIARHAPQIGLVLGKPGVETMDYFGFADDEDSYGVVKNDSFAHTEEMDDAVLPLALEVAGSSVPWLSIRNASDPQVPQMKDLEAEKKWAAGIYARFGYWTTVCSAIACWGVIADTVLS